MEKSDRPHKSPEEWLDEAIDHVQYWAISRQTTHLSHVFTGDPNGYLGIEATFVVCGDELARELHKILDATVAQFFKENIFVIPSGRPS